MSIRKCFSQTSVVVSILLLASVQPLAAATASEAERLEKLERAVEQLQERNAELEAEVSSLKKQTAAVPEGKMKTKVTYDGKTYVEKAVVEEKAPVYVQQRGPELKLTLGGFIQVNFEDGDVSAFEGRFGESGLKDRFRIRRARMAILRSNSISKSKATLAKAMDLTRIALRSQARIFSSTGTNILRRRSKLANGKRHMAWSSSLQILSYTLPSAAFLQARSRLTGKSVFNFGENRSRTFGPSRRIC